jgi:GNAT superfamily N-acetyltransferase
MRSIARMPDTGIDVRSAGRRDVRSITLILAAAFADDPAFAWMLPDDTTRARRLRRFFGTELRRHALRHGAVEVAVDGDQVVGAAIWLPPGQWSAPLIGQLLSLPGFVRAFGRGLRLGQAVVEASYRLHPRTPAHWYLHSIGVSPDYQGRGVGAALLRSRLSRCDAAGAPAYLESSKPENVPLYEHMGFVVTRTLGLPAGAPVVTAMWRAGAGGLAPGIAV